MSSRRPLSLALSFALGLGLSVAASACFTPPSDPVLFSCDFDGDDSCPPDYACREDDCCHKLGTSADDQLGACALGGNTGMSSSSTGTGTTGATETGPGSETETETGEATETGTDSTGESGSDTSG